MAHERRELEMLLAGVDAIYEGIDALRDAHDATRAVAESAPQHTAMPASMRARFTESCQGGVTRVAPTRVQKKQ